MATQGVAQPSSKKRNFLLRDLFRLCRSISRVFPRDKPNPNHNHLHKPKHERNKHNEQQRSKFHVPIEQPPPTFTFEEAKAAQGGNIGLCKVRSYRLDNNSFVGNKKGSSSLSRSCSQNTATATTATLRSLSFVGRSKSSCNRTTTDSASRTDKAMPSLMRSTSTIPRSFANPILYSSSSARIAKPQPTEEKLSCTLEELYNGCSKKIKIKRDVITSSGQTSEEEETVEIIVKPGWKGGTKVTFEGKGNEAMGSVPADLTFVIVEKEHEVFTREGDDLEMSVEVSLLEALTGCELTVALPDGDNISLKIEDVIHPGYVTVIQEKGMPNPKENGKRRGDLRVRFRIKYPPRLTDDQRTEIQSILQ